MFFIDDDDAEVDHGREDGGAGADDDASVAARDAGPLGVSTRCAEARVHDGNSDISEAGGKAFLGLRGERDFGDEDDGALAGIEDAAENAEEDFGFS